MSPCNRRRLYWSNLIIKPLKKKNIRLSDILEHGYTKKNKSTCIYCTDRPLVAFTKDHIPRFLTSLEEERCMGFPPNYTCIEGLSEFERHEMLGNSFSIPVVSHILSEMKDPILKLVTKDDQKLYEGHFSTVWFDYSDYFYE